MKKSNFVLLVLMGTVLASCRSSYLSETTPMPPFAYDGDASDTTAADSPPAAGIPSSGDSAAVRRYIPADVYVPYIVARGPVQIAKCHVARGGFGHYGAHMSAIS